MGKTVIEYLDTVKKRIKNFWDWDGTGKIWDTTDKIGEDFVVEEEDFKTDGEVCELETNLEYPEYDNRKYDDNNINGITVEEFVSKFKKENPYRNPKLKIFDVDMGLNFNDYLNNKTYSSEQKEIIVNNQFFNWKETGVIKLYIKTEKPVIETENGNPFPKIPIIEEFIEVLQNGNKDIINSYDIPKEIVKGYCRSKPTNSNYLYIDLGERKISPDGRCGKQINENDTKLIKNIAKFCRSNGINSFAINKNNLIQNESFVDPKYEIENLIVNAYFRDDLSYFEAMDKMYYRYYKMEILSKNSDLQTEIIDVIVFNLIRS